MDLSTEARAVLPAAVDRIRKRDCFLTSADEAGLIRVPAKWYPWPYLYVGHPPGSLGSSGKRCLPRPARFGRFRRRNERPYRPLEPALRIVSYSSAAVCTPPSSNRADRRLFVSAPERGRPADERASRSQFPGDFLTGR